MNIVISNVVGIIAVICRVISVQMKEKRKILVMQILGSIFYGIQYWILNSLSAVASNFIAVFRMLIVYIAEKKNKRLSIAFLLVFLIIVVTLGCKTYIGPISLIPIVIGATYTYSTWQKNTKIIRFSVFVCSIMWVYYNIQVGAYVAIIGNLLELISSTVSIIRYDIKKEKEEIVINRR